ncbi:shikimate 5-dehydrogenase [Alicyclobacillus hesperidum URH17-3-68]|uniref:Shikimate dehydrogenase (NADP(+)) n=1 Tax=Alicyclobacillus hesperidum TaxID=89784 RepID=A0A1H2UB87_9BACL|nr:shikimate dehydrogenase [Alicyclobacillus hesperidum]EJY57023.1 shikimate 5-dehydrogenase [Alicyclobacillus hesperidum URH17-3-68]GLV14160.1 shikimate dehydrogenase (NADP+) [Alicyclobacillus hesperidum]SDW53463.1 shikimate dehydrogenase [Alicyclobacillus hesperidum]
MKLFGVLGNPVAHSLSPAMMNAAFTAEGISAVYVPFRVEPEDLTDALRGLKALGAVGVNVTIPHKLGAFAWVSERTEEAELVQAVNVVRFTSSGAVGHNTDVSGWWRSVEHAMPQEPLRVVVLGAGGSVQAILAALSIHRAGIDVGIAARRAEAVLQLDKQFGHRLHLRHVAWADRHQAVADANAVIQCTPLGMWPNADTSPIDDPTVFSPGQLVQDIVYRPLETTFLRMAKEAGATVVDGASMLIWQGVDAYEWWLSQKAPAQVMADAVYSALNKERGAQ